MLDHHPWTTKNFDVKKVGLLKKGCQGRDVELLQGLLRKFNPTIKVDGDYGPTTERIVRAFQISSELTVDGAAGRNTISALIKLKPVKPLVTMVDMRVAAAELGVDLATVLTLSEVESIGAGFTSDWKPLILFERHVMHARLKINGIDPNSAMQRYPEIVNTKRGGYRNTVGEYERLSSAMAIHRVSALESASWGDFQIMGYHWKRLGYGSVDMFVEAMKASEVSHLQAFVRFIKTDSELWLAVKSKNWERVARIYNGPKYKENEYHLKLADGWTRYNGQLVGLA